MKKYFKSAPAAALFLMALASCTQPTTQVTSDIIEMRYTEATGSSNGSARAMTAAAVKACPNGYEKFGEEVIPGERKTTVWQILCLQKKEHE